MDEDASKYDDENRRALALDTALSLVGHRTDDTTADELVKEAKVIEAYLKGEVRADG